MPGVKIDSSTGLYIFGSDMPFYEGPATEEIIIDGIPTSRGFYHPRWQGEWNGFYWEDGEWVEGLSESEVKQRQGIPQTLSEIKLLVQRQIIESAAARQEALIAGYSNTERDTWDKKEQEAQSYLKYGNLADARYLKAEAEAMVGGGNDAQIREATRHLATVIVSKADELRLASAKISGIRAKKWNEVTALQTIEETLNYLVEEGWSA